MDADRMERARFAAELRRRGTLLSDEAIADVCEAFLELASGGVITLELHERLVREARAVVRAELVRSLETGTDE